MKQLKNKAEWWKWIANEMNVVNDSTEPEKYPCFVYTVVHNWGHQTVIAVYLYNDTLAQMLETLSAQTELLTDICPRCGHDFVEYCAECEYTRGS